jgi:hypothetical protein
MKYHQWFLPWYHDLITPEKRMEFIEYNTMMVQGWFHYHALAQSTVSQCFLRIRQTAPRERGPGKCRSCWIKERISFGRRSSWACYESMNLKKDAQFKKNIRVVPKRGAHDEDFVRRSAVEFHLDPQNACRFQVFPSYSRWFPSASNSSIYPPEIQHSSIRGLVLFTNLPTVSWIGWRCCEYFPNGQSTTWGIKKGRAPSSFNSKTHLEVISGCFQHSCKF